MSAQSLSNFTSELRNRNISRPSLYYVEIVPPPILKSVVDTNNMNLISMWCSSAMTPQSTILTRDDYLEDGIRRKFAYDQDYQNLTLHFYVDQDFEIQKFFDQWKDSIVNQRRKFGYPDDYTADTLNLFIINQEDKPTYKYEYSRIYPKSINSVELSYASGSAISTFSIDFVYEEVYHSSIKNSVDVVFTSKPPTAITEEKSGQGITNPELKQIYRPTFPESKNSFISGNGGDFGGGGATGGF